MAENTRSEGSLSFRTYVGRLVLYSLPVINVGAALFWLFAGKDEETKSFGKAALAVVLILTAVSLVLGLVSYGYLASAVWSR
ncbi:MAG: hypothetical protein ACOCW6_06260 [Spirochaetota bacterium]